jgi:hypothetical protein
VSAVLAALGVLAGAVAVLLGPADGDLSRVPAVSWVFFVAVAVVAGATVVRALVRPPARVLFRLVMLASLLLAAQLVASGGALAG